MSPVPSSGLSGLAPIADAATEILILGSFPSEASLRAQQYYGHPRNHFWKLLGAVLDEPLHALSYAERVSCLLAHRIGVWDVIAACERAGSLDSAIRNEQANDFEALFTASPRVHLVALNGGKAGRYRRVFEVLGKDVVVLPSSSPANATHSFDVKRSRWTENLKNRKSGVRSKT